MKESFKRDKPHFTLGVVGPSGIGKTALCIAICDHLGFPTHAWERYVNPSGETTVPSHFEFETEHRHYTLIDLPGSPAYRKNLWKGLGSLDGALVMVSDHFEDCATTSQSCFYFSEFGIPIIALYNQAENQHDTISLQGTAVYECHIPRIGHPSNWDQYSYDIRFEELLGSIDRLPTPERDSEGAFLMPISEVYPVTNVGTVITGKIKRGRVRLADDIEIAGQRESRITMVTGIEMCYRSLEEGIAGDQISLLMRGVDPKEIRKGQLAAAPGSLNLRKTFRARFKKGSSGEERYDFSFRRGFQLQCLFYGRGLAGAFSESIVDDRRVQLFRYWTTRDWSEFREGETIDIVIELMYPTDLNLGQKFILLVDQGFATSGTVLELM